jgi:hypothetical protein
MDVWGAGGNAVKFFFNFGTRWREWSASRSVSWFPEENSPVFTGQEVVFGADQFVLVAKKISLHLATKPGHPRHTTGSWKKNIIFLNI